MNLIRKIIINNFIVLFERLFTAFLGFLVAIWLVRYLGAEKFGTYSLVFAWFSLLNVFTPWMIEQVVAREAVRFPEQMRKYLGAGLTLKLGLALLGWGVGLGFAFLLGYPRQTIFYLGIVLLGLLGNASFVLQVPHQIELRLLLPSLADGLSSLLYQLGRALAILFRLGLLPFFWLYLGYRLLQLTFFLFLGLEKKQYQPCWGFSWKEVRIIFQASWILIIINVFIMVIGRIDQLLIYNFLGTRAVGLYGSCANLTDYLMLIPSTWYLTVFPLITKYLGESSSAYESANRSSYKYLTITAVLIWIIFGGFSQEVITLLFGADYQDASSVLFWLSTGMVFSFLQFGLFNAALSKGKESLWILVSGTGAVFNVALNLILIPRFGIGGAGFATFTAYLVFVILAGFLNPLRSDFLIMLKSAFLPIVLGASLIALSRGFGLKLMIGGPAMLIINLFLLFLTKSISKDDLKLLYQALLPGEK